MSAAGRLSRLSNAAIRLFLDAIPSTLPLGGSALAIAGGPYGGSALAIAGGPYGGSALAIAGSSDGGSSLGIAGGPDGGSALGIPGGPSLWSVGVCRLPSLTN